MLYRRIRIGAAAGLCAAAAVIAATHARQAEVPPAGRLLADCGGEFRTLVLQYNAEAEGVTGAACREFLGSLPRGAEALVVCPDRNAWETFANSLPPTQATVTPVFAGGAITGWARDRWLALRRAGGGTLLYAPFRENLQENWPARRNDGRVAELLAVTRPERAEFYRSRLLFDGGDFVTDGETAFVTPAVARRNVGITVKTRDELRERLERDLGVRVELLPSAPEHHAGMFMMAAGKKRLVVGDPALARRILAETGAACIIPDPDWSAETQERFDAVAEFGQAEGYAVARLPVVCAKDGRTWLTPLNVVLGGGAAYVPAYRGNETLDAAARRGWEELGYRVVPIDCTDTYRQAGSLRCMVNVLERAE